MEILEHVPLELNTISGDTARCTKCNSTTSQIHKSKVTDKIPERVSELIQTSKDSLQIIRT